jgi:hypothetical protein
LTEDRECDNLRETSILGKTMKPEITKDQHGVIRWNSNNAVIPPELLENEGMVFDAEAQYAAFVAMAERHAEWWLRMPQEFSTEAHKMTMFVDMALGRLILRPAIGEKR